MKKPRTGVLLTILGTAAVFVGLPQGAPAPPGASSTKRIATWLVFNQEKDFSRIQANADLLASLSVFGDPPREFIDRCHALGIEVYKAVSGDASAFDPPSAGDATLEKYLADCRAKGYDGIDLDFEHLDPALQGRYSSFLRKVSAALHRAGRKLSHCVGFYPGMELDPPRQIFYDPKTVGETCDQVRVMCYDLYWAPGRGDPKMQDRADTQGIGPTSNFPWARQAMLFWLGKVERARLVMGLPAYSNEYSLAEGGRGRQVYASRPALAAGAAVEEAWLWYERLPVYLYWQTPTAPHLFYASDARSTEAHLETVRELGLPNFGFWHFSSVDDETWKTVRNWLEKNR